MIFFINCCNLLKLLLACIEQIFIYNTFRFKYLCLFIYIAKYSNILLFWIDFIQKSRFYGKFSNYKCSKKILNETIESMPSILNIYLKHIYDQFMTTFEWFPISASWEHQNRCFELIWKNNLVGCPWILLTNHDAYL